MRGKYISLDKFSGVADGVSGFCDCVLGWDVNDQLYDNASFTGWHTAFPDALYRIDLNTERRLKEEGGIPLFLAEFVSEDESTPSNLPAQPPAKRDCKSGCLGLSVSHGL